MEREAQLRALYSAFNARDIDAVLSPLAEDVEWPNAWEGGRLRGRDAVRLLVAPVGRHRPDLVSRMDVEEPPGG